MAVSSVVAEYDRAKEVKEFSEAKIGVKGLMDSGITSIPPFFIQPSKTLSTIRPTMSTMSNSTTATTIDIPMIDLSGASADRRSRIVDQIRDASRTLGMFYITNHGILDSVLDEAIAGIKSFHEQPAEVKAKYYPGKLGGDVVFIANHNLSLPTAATWRDSLQIRWTPKPPEHEQIPTVCLKEMVALDEHMKLLGETLMELLNEGLGLAPGRLKEYMEDRSLLAHYYPYCPQPDLALGTHPHSDASIITVLLYNQINGLQVKCGPDWVDVKPTTRSILVNIGDFLQVISNDEFKSLEHRVLANSFREPRVTMAFFFVTADRSKVYGPLPELLTQQKPAVYRNLTLSEYLRARHTALQEMESEIALSYFKL